jgi:hypothetical protein
MLCVSLVYAVAGSRGYAVSPWWLLLAMLKVLADLVKCGICVSRVRAVRGLEWLFVHLDQASVRWDRDFHEAFGNTLDFAKAATPPKPIGPAVQPKACSCGSNAAVHLRRQTTGDEAGECVSKFIASGYCFVDRVSPREKMLKLRRRILASGVDGRHENPSVGPLELSDLAHR